jgi:hypothetical protein
VTWSGVHGLVKSATTPSGPAFNAYYHQWAGGVRGWRAWIYKAPTSREGWQRFYADPDPEPSP